MLTYTMLYALKYSIIYFSLTCQEKQTHETRNIKHIYYVLYFSLDIMKVVMKNEKTVTFTSFFMCHNIKIRENVMNRFCEIFVFLNFWIQKQHTR